MKILTLLLAACLGSSAAPILYNFTVTGSGSLNGAAFTNTGITFTGSGDTDQVASTNTLPNIAFTIPGTVSGFINTPYLYVNQGACTSSPAYPTISSCVGFGATLDLLTVASNVFADYALITPIGPVFDPTPAGNLNTPFPTSAGDLRFSTLSNASFTATAIPEPSTLLLLSSVLSASLLWRRVSRKRRGTAIPVVFVCHNG